MDIIRFFLPEGIHGERAVSPFACSMFVITVMSHDYESNKKYFRDVQEEKNDNYNVKDASTTI
ncbi:hypothetical protein LU631_15145 [Erwinia tracheiphila]|uniref:Uncharacterized protein n=1 Tax=Erwinia tracheiphila TaxID=65700 RepID=A0A0M2K5L3_9GAMM|nr:hypothetical protein [Erwinia tracheiphila]KKF34670.1 hypothetical protein SY86_03185 [Erwinia tracheiphila]UIA85445.1 hypothetical protein LU604_12020 [Erwinia tracheiphila]UIA86342.1 hypothetical protein LU631_15145 [Erwinia tracheiphila]UIA93965.1 hypothetical protein LU632_11590 [Erwinia tracheiphila]UIA94662.1 hypothetical protein LU633_13355 [Erwinia tracheiphila]